MKLFHVLILNYYNTDIASSETRLAISLERLNTEFGMLCE